MPVDIGPAQVISDLVPILKALLDHDVTVVVDVEAEHAWIRVDPTQFEQVIVNLATNARDSMPIGGTVTIELHDLRSADPDRPDPELSAGPSVRISVSDTGTRMDEATRARIFDPFYTTKDPGKGTGLGLSTVLGIVAQAGGQIQVETAPKKGSTFHVDLPGVSAGLPDPGICPKRYSDGLASLRRSGVVLLAEDDHAVREFARRSLEAAGYMVLAADGADQALRASEGWCEAIDVLVTDIVMPGLHGPGLAARIRAQRPGIGVVFMSGYADDAGRPGADIRVPGAFLPKPFSVEALSRAVGRPVDANRAWRNVVRGG